MWLKEGMAVLLAPVKWTYMEKPNIYRVKIYCRSLKTSGILDVDPRTVPQLRLNLLSDNWWLETLTYSTKSSILDVKRFFNLPCAFLFPELSISRFEEQINKTEAKNEAKNNKLFKSIIYILACWQSI